MAPARRAGKSKAAASAGSSGLPPAPFKAPPQVLQPFIDGLSEKHVYIAHIDNKPAAFKRKIFLVPVAMNVAIAAMFVYRVYSISPWYWKMIVLAFGHHNDLAFATEEATWGELAWELGRRALTMLIDFLLFVFVWPWPVEFAAGQRRGNPTNWRYNVGFRDKEIYVRCSRDWDKLVGDFVQDADSRKILTAYIHQATSPLLQEQKTGYLLMNGAWDLDWRGMVRAHAMVDKKDIALEAFKNVILVHHKQFGWLVYDLKTEASEEAEDKRRQVFAFRDALTAMGKENLFYRWVETVQFEATQPGGFGPDKQEVAAKKIRELFQAEDIDFDELWKDTAGAA